jgi:predicted nucleic acid-binding protein
VSFARVPAGVTDRILCLDTSVWIAYLTPDDLQDAATALVVEALREDAGLVAPAFGWAEVGSVLRKKVRAGLIDHRQADAQWRSFQSLPVRTVDTAEVRARAWELAHRFSFPTLYDAAFLACTELAVPSGVERAFWTADQALIRMLGNERPSYVRLLI